MLIGRTKKQIPYAKKEKPQIYLNGKNTGTIGNYTEDLFYLRRNGVLAAGGLF